MSTDKVKDRAALTSLEWVKILLYSTLPLFTKTLEWRFHVVMVSPVRDMRSYPLTIHCPPSVEPSDSMKRRGAPQLGLNVTSVPSNQAVNFCSSSALPEIWFPSPISMRMESARERQEALYVFFTEVLPPFQPYFCAACIASRECPRAISHISDCFGVIVGGFCSGCILAASCEEHGTDEGACQERVKIVFHVDEHVV